MFVDRLAGPFYLGGLLNSKPIRVCAAHVGGFWMTSFHERGVPTEKFFMKVGTFGLVSHGTGSIFYA